MFDFPLRMHLKVYSFDYHVECIWSFIPLIPSKTYSKLLSNSIIECIWSLINMTSTFAKLYVHLKLRSAFKNESIYIMDNFLIY